jgi:hypothetical protein
MLLVWSLWGLHRGKKGRVAMGGISEWQEFPFLFFIVDDKQIDINQYFAFLPQ